MLALLPVLALAAANAPPPPSPVFRDVLAMPRQLQADANGLRVSYLEWGPPAGPLVLCLHGFPVSARTWDVLGPQLARQGYRVVAPWLRGYAPTAAPATDDYGPETLGRDALALMTALGAPKAAIVGHDWGASAAFAAASLAPERVTKLVAVAIPHPAAIPSSAVLRAHHFLTLPLPGAVGRLQADDYDEVGRIMRRWSPMWELPESEVTEAKRAFRVPGGASAILGYYRAAMADTLFHPEARAISRRKIAVPTLSIYGLADGALDAGVYDQTAPFFTARYERVMIPRAGHFPHREAPIVFNAAVQRFLLQE